MLLIKPEVCEYMLIFRRLVLRTRAKFHTERLARTQDRVADSNARCLLINLDRGLVRVDTDDLCPPY